MGGAREIAVSDMDLRKEEGEVVYMTVHISEKNDCII